MTKPVENPLEPSLWEKWQGAGQYIGIIGLLSVIASLIFPEIYGPFKVLGPPFWVLNTGPLEWLYDARFLLAWGVCFSATYTLWVLYKKRHLPTDEASKERLWKATCQGLGQSLYSGVTEELKHRWALFSLALPLLAMMNWFGDFIPIISLAFLALLVVWAFFEGFLRGALSCAILVVGYMSFGEVGAGFLPWFMSLVVYIADFITVGYMHDALYAVGHPQTEYTWSWGAAIIMSSGKFRPSQFQSWPRFINAWYFGMIQAWVMLTHGILAAILVHFVHDILVTYTVISIHGVRGLWGSRTWK